jgi:hypothetical protein
MRGVDMHSDFLESVRASGSVTTDYIDIVIGMANRALGGVVPATASTLWFSTDSVTPFAVCPQCLRIQSHSIAHRKALIDPCRANLKT